MNSGCIGITPAGQTPDAATLAVMDAQSRVTFYQVTTAIALAAAIGLYYYPRKKSAITAGYGSARERVNRGRRSIAKAMMPLGGVESHL